MNLKALHTINHDKRLFDTRWELNSSHIRNLLQVLTAESHRHKLISVHSWLFYILVHLYRSILLCLVHTADTDKTRLVLSASAVWTELVTSQDCRRLKISKQFCPVSKCDVNWVLSVCDSQRGYLLWRHIWKLGQDYSSWMCSHRRWDWRKLFSVRYIEDYWKLSATVANSVYTADKTRQDSL